MCCSREHQRDLSLPLSPFLSLSLSFSFSLSHSLAFSSPFPLLQSELLAHRAFLFRQHCERKVEGGEVENCHCFVVVVVAVSVCLFFLIFFSFSFRPLELVACQRLDKRFHSSWRLVPWRQHENNKLHFYSPVIQKLVTHHILWDVISEAIVTF